MIRQRLSLFYRVSIGTIFVVALVAVVWQLRTGNREVDESEPGSEVSLATKANPGHSLALTRAIAFELPLLSSSPFENTSAAATYVGTNACTECHPNQHRSHRATTHSRALGLIDVAAEPPDASFDHPATGRTYRIYRKDGDLHHRESIKDDDGTELIATDHRIKYVVGSGHFTRSYLVENDGFLAESPLTWYQSKQAWELSPGYDRPDHPGFERAIDASCLYCHVGRIENPERRYQRVTVLEQAIGCERCHGPGSLHVDRHRTINIGSIPVESNERPTIVNPSKLSRSLNEAICSHCHLMGETMVSVRGRSLYDFRPGLPLTDFYINYRLDPPDPSMKVVGHVEQMHQSACYRATDSLTCTTCHSGHAEIPPEHSRAHHLRVCLSCHASDSACKLDPKQRLHRSPTNDCLACHMPQVPTDIAHVAFTHHRIGIHESPSQSKQQTASVPLKSAPELVPMDDLPQQSNVERDRNLGLAYFGLSQLSSDRRFENAYRQRAFRLLAGVRSSGLTDITVTATLFQLYHLKGDSNSARQLEREILDTANIPVKSRVSSLFLVANDGMRTNRIDVARGAIEELIELRRHSSDWWMRGAFEQRSGDLDSALSDFEHAASISPFRPQIHDSIAQIHDQLGHRDAADRERRIAKHLIAPKPTSR